MNDQPRILSILIPSFKRTSTLEYLLSTIPLRDDIEVLVHSDNGPNWHEILRICEVYLIKGLNIKYKNNSETLGLDLNIHSLLSASRSEYSILMGDDDYFLTEELNHFASSLYDCKSMGVKSLLRSYFVFNSLTDSLDRFSYYSSDTTLPSSLHTLAWTFKRSVSLAGVVLHTKSATSNFTSELVGSLLSHAYLAAVATQSYPTLAIHTPFAVARDTWREGDYQFGISKNEKNFQPGKNITTSNSLAFLLQFKQVAHLLDLHYPGSYSLISSDLSKYSYPFLSVQRPGSIFKFLSYCHDVEKLDFFNKNPLYYCYKSLLIVLGETMCTKLIHAIKNILGKTPIL